jgi:thymidylate synthase
MKLHTTESERASEETLLNCMKNILENGKPRIDRTLVGTLSIFSVELRFNIEDDKIPLMTTRSMSVRMIFEELMWILRGQTDVSILQSKKVNIWNDNSTREFLDKRGLTHLKEGDIGAGYGFQMRHSGATYVDCKTDYSGKGFDQLTYVIDLLKNDPYSRRIMINLWNPPDLDKMSLPPCGFCYQFYVDNEGGEGNMYLSCKITQRSSDIALAGCWNVVSCSIFVKMLAWICGMKPREIIWSVGDCHIYSNQIENVKEQLERIDEIGDCPRLEIRERTSVKNITDFEYSDFELRNYNPQKAIKFAMNA